MGRNLNITSEVLDGLGFSEYWDEHEIWGTRTFVFSNGQHFRIIEQEAIDDDSDGYSLDGQYVANHFYFGGWMAWPKIDKGKYDLFFLHEMYDCLKECYPDCLEEFVSICKNVKMGKYIDDYLERKVV